jgi:excinuclease ABC subunit C
VQVFFIRGGKMIGREYFLMEGTEDSQDQDVLAEFIKQFYDQAANVPSEVLLPKDIEEAAIIKQWLNQRTDQKVEIKIPRRGKKKDLIRLAAENATETLSSLQSQWESDKHRQTQSLAELQEALGMETSPNRIECYDISNTQGTAIVGSMVVFEQGVPNKKLYRRFNIRTVVGGPDDYASMDEVLSRRFKRWQAAQEKAETPGKKPDESFSRLPDVLIVDGGKGQLSRTVQVLEEFDLLGRFVVAGLAKQNEELFIHGKTKSLLLPRKSEGLYLLQRIRDEAHRFAITAHRKRRSREGITSILDVIPGIGPAKRKALLTTFGSLEKIRKASIEELAAVRGINQELAEIIQSHLE